MAYYPINLIQLVSFQVFPLTPGKHRISNTDKVFAGILLCLLIGIDSVLNAQSLSRYAITPFGYAYDNNYQIIQATLGEPVVTTDTDSATFYLTQGFQQPSPRQLPREEYRIGIEIYPNPVIDEARVKFYVMDINDYTIQVSNLTGVVIYARRVTEIYSGQVEVIDFRAYAQGIYFIRVYSNKYEIKEVKKMVKL